MKQKIKMYVPNAELIINAVEMPAHTIVSSKCFK